MKAVNTVMQVLVQKYTNSTLTPNPVVGILSVGILSGWDFVRWDFVRWDFVRWDFVRWDFVLAPAGQWSRRPQTATHQLTMTRFSILYLAG